MSTRSQAILLRETQPYLTLPAIAQRLGVTKQRIFRILKDGGLPTKGLYQRKRLVYCPVCHNPTPNKQQVCPGKCRDEIKFVWVECEFCHLNFQRKKRIIKDSYRRGYLHIFCSKSCYNRGQRDGITGRKS
jgi:hypothetical protein